MKNCYLEVCNSYRMLSPPSEEDWKLYSLAGEKRKSALRVSVYTLDIEKHFSRPDSCKMGSFSREITLP